MGTERPSKSMLKPSITSHSRAGSQALGTEKLLERHPEGPAPILPSSEDCGRDAAMDDSKAATGWRPGRGRQKPGQPALGGLDLTCFSSLPLATCPASLLTPAKVLSVLSTYGPQAHCSFCLEHSFLLLFPFLFLPIFQVSP